MTEISEISLPPRDGIASALAELYLSAGWIENTESSTDSIASALTNSYCAYGAFDGGKFVGFVRALCDGVGDAYIVDFVVAPEFRKRGIGGHLIERITGRLRSEQIDWITAIAEPDSKGIFLKYGTKMKECTPFRF